MLIVSAMDLIKRDDSRFLISLRQLTCLDCVTLIAVKKACYCYLINRERPAPSGVTSRNCRRVAQKCRRSICLPPIGKN